MKENTLTKKVNSLKDKNCKRLGLSREEFDKMMIHDIEKRIGVKYDFRTYSPVVSGLCKVTIK